jgi:hypothetical protein
MATLLRGSRPPTVKSKFCHKVMAMIENVVELISEARVAA